MRGTIGFFMHSTRPNSRRAFRMSPASRAVRDVELTALEHVRPVEPGKQLRLQEPHAAAGNARVEREARRHLAAIGELGEYDLAIGDGERAGPVAVIGFRQRLAFHCGEQIGDHDGRLYAHGRCGLGVGRGSRISEGEDIRIANMTQVGGIDLNPAGGVRERACADDIEAGLRRHDMDHVEALLDACRQP